MELLKWIWRGLMRRFGMMASEIPPPPHLRDPEVAEHFLVEPVEEHDTLPAATPGVPEQEAQAHPHPAERRPGMQN